MRWLAGILLLVLLAGCGSAPAAVAPPAGLVLRAPASAEVGTPLSVVITASGGADQPVQLITHSSFGTRVDTVELHNGSGQLTIAEPFNQQAGDLSLHALAGTVSATATISLRPAAVVDPLIPLVGARSITADGEHWSMAVVIPHDRFGNAVAAGTPVTVRARHPGGRLTTLETRTAHLLAWVRVTSGRIAGRTEISVASSGQFGPAADLLEVPGWPQPFALELSGPALLIADGRQLLTIRTSLLEDRFGNVLPDGTLVTFVITDRDGLSRRLTAPIISGIAQVPLQAPAQATRLQLSASVFNVTSSMLALDFKPGTAALELPVAVSILTDTISVTVGPVLGDLEQFMPVGSLVELELSGPSPLRQQQPVIDGYAQFQLRQAGMDPGRYTLRVVIGDSEGSASFQLTRKQQR